MKKGMKKITALFAAVMMIFSMCLTGNAADITHTVTINGGDNSLENVRFDAYKLFEITGTAVDGKYGHTPTANFETWLTEKANETTGEGVGVYDYVNAQMSKADTAQTFLSDLKTYIEGTQSINADATVTGTNGQTSVQLENLTPGYYVIYPATNGNAKFSPMAVNVTDKDETVYVKVSEPTIDKTTEDGKEWADAQIGTKIPFKVTVQVPNTEGMDMSTYKFQVVDTMSKGLTFSKEDVKVTIGDATLTSDMDYTVTEVTSTENTKITFNFVMGTDENRDLSATLKNNVGKNIVISYNAVLNENAVSVNPETNSASLEYTNQSGEEISGDAAPDDNTKIYTYEYDFVKKAETENGAALKGAEFEIYTADKRTKINFVNVENGYRVAKDGENGVTLVTGEDGKLHVYGLEAGTYYLKETKAPDGYNKLKDMISFEIESNEDGTQTADHSLTVINKAGTLLPETGGVGSVAFAVLGGLIVLGGAVVLIRNRRNTEV